MGGEGRNWAIEAEIRRRMQKLGGEGRNRVLGAEIGR